MNLTGVSVNLKKIAVNLTGDSVNLTGIAVDLTEVFVNLTGTYEENNDIAICSDENQED